MKQMIEAVLAYLHNFERAIGPDNDREVELNLLILKKHRCNLTRKSDLICI